MIRYFHSVPDTNRDFLRCPKISSCIYGYQTLDLQGTFIVQFVFDLGAYKLGVLDCKIASNFLCHISSPQTARPRRLLQGTVSQPDARCARHGPHLSSLRENLSLPPPVAIRRLLPSSPGPARRPTDLRP